MTELLDHQLMKIKQAKRKLSELFKKHDRAVLTFSGGKDSLVIYDLCKDYLHRITPVWVNTGASLPHMKEFIKQYHVIEVRSDQPSQIAEYGLPVDMVPIVNAYDPTYPNSQDPKIQDWRFCCAKNRWKPLTEYLTNSGVSLEIHGQKKDDRATGIFEKKIERGIETYALIWSWTDSDVMKYLDHNKIKLPDQYPHAASSFDCWNCTAIDEGHEWFYSRYLYLQKKYPELASQLRERMHLVARAIDNETTRIKKTFDSILSPERSD